MDTLKPSSLILMWFKPRKTIRYLSHYCQSSLSHFGMMAGVVLLYFIQLELFLRVSGEDTPIAKALSLENFPAIGMFFVLLGAWSYIVINTLTLTIWMVAKYLKGKASLPETRLALLWSMVCFIPHNFFAVLLQYTFKRMELGQETLKLEIIFLIAVIVSAIYGFIVMLKTISETHHFSLWRSFCSIFLGLPIALVILFTIIIPFVKLAKSFS